MADLTRRTFVASGGAATVLATAPGVVGSAVGAASATPLRVGVLTTDQSSFTQSGRSLLDGLAVGFAASPYVVATLDSRPVAYGLVGAVEGATELVASGAQVVVAGISAPASRLLADACAEAGVGLVLANVGAHVVSGPQRPGVLHSTMQHWQSALVAGQWAASELGRRLFTIVSVPDAGYDTVFAVRRGFVAAGGEFLGAALTHESGDGGVAAAVKAARTSRADVVAVSASGRRAAEIVRACRAGGLKAALVVDSLALEGFAIGELGRTAIGVHSVASWTRSTDTAAGRAFVQTYRAQTGRSPDAFAALGHDTALLVAEGVRRVFASGRPWSELAESLAGAKVPGARGTQIVHRTLRTVSTPLAVRQVRAKSGVPKHVVVAGRPRVVGTPASMSGLESGLEAGRVAAYLNEYLAT
jgi:branched-chain amino acid transport system substrate-binding protein